MPLRVTESVGSNTTCYACQIHTGYQDSIIVTIDYAPKQERSKSEAITDHITSQTQMEGGTKVQRSVRLS